MPTDAQLTPGASTAKGDTFCTGLAVRCRHIFRPSCVPITIVLLFVVMVLIYPVINEHGMDNAHMLVNGTCADECTLHLVESIPFNLTYNHSQVQSMSTFDAWKWLIDNARSVDEVHRLDLAVFYWALRGQDVYEHWSDYQGQDIFDRLQQSAQSGTKMRIAQSASKEEKGYVEPDILVKNGAESRTLNMSDWFNGGVVHTKLMLAGQRHSYVGSANMDWRSLTQIYWLMGRPGARLPAYWPRSLGTSYNKDTPMVVKLNGTLHQVYISAAPPEFAAKGRTDDKAAIIHTIDTADVFVHIAVMDYVPAMMYTGDSLWPLIDNAIRAAAYQRGVKVRLLVSKWKHTPWEMAAFVRNLLQFNQAIKDSRGTGSIEARWFTVPTFEGQESIPFARVNHNKYMVTDNTAYIGTSNWSGDYFVNTAGIGLIVRNYPGDNANVTVAKQLNDVFMRDWNSEYATAL